MPPKIILISYVLFDMQINEKYFYKQLFLQDEIDIILEFINIGKIIELG